MKLAKPRENPGCLMGAFIIITLGLIILALMFGVFNAALNVWAQ
jgi:hypothetical protein